MAYFKENLTLKVFSFFRNPLISYVSPKIVEVTEKRCVLKVRLKRRTRNFLGTMFLGALTTGADVAAGLPIILESFRLKKKISFAVKMLECSFLKAAKSDVYFYVENTDQIRNFVHELLANPGVRKEHTVEVTAKCPDTSGDETVARFTVLYSGKN